MSSDAMPDYGPFMEHLVAGGKKLVVCTHGRRGSSALTQDGQWIDTSIIQSYTRVDTNGAGDSFQAGFIYAHSKGYSTEVALQIATIVGGLCVTSSELAHPALSAQLVEEEYSKYYRA